jgi:hypothetical protein
MFASCALRPVSRWVFWLRTSIFVYGRVRQRFGKIGYTARVCPAPLLLAKFAAAAISIES